MAHPAIITIILANCLSLFYLVYWLSKPVSQNRSLFKIVPMIVLIIAALVSAVSPLIILGLFACLMGDYFLSLEGEKNFLLGLSAFLLGHLFYITFFISGFDPGFFLLSESKETLFLLAALAVLVLFRLWPYLNDLKIPVIIYTLAIMAMAYFARMAAPGIFVLTGVVLFVISDVILANDKFTPLTNNWFRKSMPYAVWLLYFMGQSLIVAGMIVPMI
jgi:uncharacterized membrane protein YhhN